MSGSENANLAGMVEQTVGQQVAIEEFVGVWRESRALTDLAAVLTDEEIDALVGLLRAYSLPDQAQLLLDARAADEGE